jgi:hypothetical protein
MQAENDAVQRYTLQKKKHNMWKNIIYFFNFIYLK